MNKNLKITGLLISITLIGFIGWINFYTPISSHIVDEATQHKESNDESIISLSVNSIESSLPELEIPLEQVSINNKNCVINSEPDFITKLKICKLTDDLKSKKFKDIKNIIVHYPFEVIYKGKSIAAINDQNEVIQNYDNLIEKIGTANGEAIYIKSFYEYAFAESDYSKESAIEIYEDYVLLREEISIYPQDEIKKAVFYTEQKKPLTDSDLNFKDCAEINEFSMTLINNEYLLHYDRCITKGPVSDEDKVVVEFNDKELEKCIRKNARINKTRAIQQYDLNLLKELICISPRIESIEGLSKIPYLITLSLNIKNIKSFKEIKKLTKIKALTLRNSDNLDLNEFLDLTDLRYLRIYKVNGIDFSLLYAFHQLKTLLIENVSMNETVFLRNISGIENLSLASNHLSDFEYYLGLDLKYLDLSNNKLTHLDWVYEYTNLEQIKVGNNNLINIDALKELGSLKVINAKNNQIKDASKFAYIISNISELNLQNNPIDCSITPLLTEQNVNLSCP